MFWLSAIKSGHCSEVAEMGIRGGSTLMIRPTKSLKCNQMNAKKIIPIKDTTCT